MTVSQLPNARTRLTVDYMMTVGKYFASNHDYINLMRTCKMYRKIVLMYKYNPISDCRLFKNIKIQHFYQYRDIFYRNRDMDRYVYWINRCFVSNYLAMIDSSKCILKSSKANKMIKYASDLGQITHTIKAVSSNGAFYALYQMDCALAIFEYNTTYFGLSVTDGNATCFVNKDTFTDLSMTVNERVGTIKLFDRDRGTELAMFFIVNGQLKVQLEEKLCIRHSLPVVMDIADWCLVKYC